MPYIKPQYLQEGGRVLPSSDVLMNEVLLPRPHGPEATVRSHLGSPDVMLEQTMPDRGRSTWEKFKEGPSIGDVLGVAGGPSMAGAMAPALRGIRAWHASPYDIEKFDIRKVGTGQGAQSYSPGIYFAENPKVSGQGGEYWREFTRHSALSPEEVATAGFLEAHKFNRKDAIAGIQRNIGQLRGSDSQRQLLKLRESMLELLKGDKPIKPITYETEIRTTPDKLLDWDRPLGEQSALIQSFPEFAGAAKHEAHGRHLSATTRAGSDKYYEMVKDPLKATGQIAYQGAVGLGGHTREAAARLSDRMKEAGIPGVRYLDAGSRPISTETIADASRGLELSKQRLASLRAHESSTPADIRAEENVVKHFETQLRRLQNPTYNYAIRDDSILHILRKLGLMGGAAAPAVAEGLKERESGGRVQYLQEGGRVLPSSKVIDDAAATIAMEAQESAASSLRSSGGRAVRIARRLARKR